MTYDNEQLCQIFNDREQTMRLAMSFLDQTQNEMSGDKDPEFVSFLRKVSEAHITRQVGIVWEMAESPIERIFIVSFMMNFIRNHDPLGLVITPSMGDAERNMDELRQSIADMKRAMVIREKQGGDTSPAAVLNDLKWALESGKLPADQYDLNLHMVWCYHSFELQGALHLTPQATFPKALLDGRGVRADLMFWVPDYAGFRIVVECDSYQYRDNKERFDHDRQRSRALQRRSFKVLQYSGGEIYRDPIRTSFDLYDYLTDELERFGNLNQTQITHYPPPGGING